MAIPLIALLTIGFCRMTGARWSSPLLIIVYPVIFVVDLFGWLYYAGTRLTPARR
ncbi:MAG: hypothetical protein R2853_12030 [Thermomicrobiales bacterium]